MKTICSLLVTLFITVVLVASATPPSTPTINVTCQVNQTSCDLVDYSATNLDPSTAYEIEGVNSTTGEQHTWSGDPAGGFMANNGTSYDSGQTNESLDLGDWTFELHAIGNNG